MDETITTKIPPSLPRRNSLPSSRSFASIALAALDVTFHESPNCNKTEIGYILGIASADCINIADIKLAQYGKFGSIHGRSFDGENNQNITFYRDTECTTLYAGESGVGPKDICINAEPVGSFKIAVEGV